MGIAFAKMDYPYAFIPAEKRREMLRKHYPTLEALLNAPLSEFFQILPAESANALYEKLHNGERND